MSEIQVKDKDLDFVVATYTADDYNIENNTICGVHFDIEKYELILIAPNDNSTEEQEEIENPIDN